MEVRKMTSLTTTTQSSLCLLTRQSQCLAWSSHPWTKPTASLGHPFFSQAFGMETSSCTRLNQAWEPKSNHKWCFKIMRELRFLECAGASISQQCCLHARTTTSRNGTFLQIRSLPSVNTHNLSKIFITSCRITPLWLWAVDGILGSSFGHGRAPLNSTR